MGGTATLDSYGPGRDLSLIPDEHYEFLEGCLDFHETDTHIFVHANYFPDIPMAEQHVGMLRWESLRDMTPGPHRVGQDGHRRPHVAEERRDPRPGPPDVHRHLLPRRRLADGPGREDRRGLAGRPRGEDRRLTARRPPDFAQNICITAISRRPARGRRPSSSPIFGRPANKPVASHSGARTVGEAGPRPALENGAKSRLRFAG